MKRILLVLSTAAVFALVSGCTTYYAGPPPSRPYASRPYGTHPNKTGPPAPVFLRIVQPEYLVLVPGLSVYFVPDVSADIFYYGGCWYYRLGASWYWGTSYRGPWTYTELRAVPRPLRQLPRDYRTRYRSGRYRIPYGHWKKRDRETPPPGHYRRPSFLYRVPGPDIYIVPGVSAEIVFYNGNWYNRFKGVWYVGPGRTGPWNFIGEGKVPRKLWELPPDYRNRVEKYERVPYEKWEKKHRRKKRKGKREDEEDD